MGTSDTTRQDYSIKVESLQNQVAVSVPDRKTRSLFKWISRITGVDACWIEGIDRNDNPIWGIAKKLTRRLWYIVSRRLKPALAVTALGGALLLPVQAVQAQTSVELSSLNGANGFMAAGDAGASGLALAAGDFNNDGIEDLVIGAPNAPGGAGTNVGKTYVVFGKNSGFSASIDLSGLSGTDGYILNGIDSPDNSGRAVATGDINGDGIDDIIIGAYNADQPSNLEAGETYLIFGDELANADSDDGSSDGSIDLSSLDGTTGLVIKGITGDDYSGRVVDAGDINGDNIDDVIIGAFGADPNSNAESGATYVMFGKSTSFGSLFELSDLSGSNGFVINGVAAGDNSGRSVSSADINDDDVEDVIIGAPGAGSSTGASYVVFGASDVGSSGSIELSGLTGTNGFAINGIDTDDESGRAVSAGDVNGDEIGDVIIGAFHADPSANDNSGESYVVFGGSSVGSVGSIELSGLSGGDGFVLNGINAYDESGYSVASGDINGDGADDVIIGALVADPNGSNSGETYVVLGGSSVGSGGTIELSGLSGSDGFVLNGIDASDFSGRATSAGDINGDGVDDVIVGAPGAAGSDGETYVFFNTTYQTITGNEGFRLLSAPISGTVFDELLGNFWTQGFTGADAGDSFADNVWTWDETLNTNDQFGGSANTGGWTPLTDQSTNSLAAGQGFMLYVFSDDDADGTPEGFPKHISSSQFTAGGTANSGTINPISNLGDGRFFLAGNPYDRTIDWDLLTLSNIQGTVYIYDDASSAFISWNGSTGGVTDGLIAPYQGFFIEGNGGSGSLTIEEADIAGTEGTFYKQSETEPLVLKLDLEADGHSNPAWLQFDEQGELGRDRLDGLELQPLANNYLQLYSRDADGKSLNINALPANRDGIIEIPLQMLRVQEGTSTEASGILRWSGLEAFPAGWQFTLLDTQTGEEIDLSLASEHSVAIDANTKVKANGNDDEKQPLPTPVMQSSSGESRYVLKVTTGDPAGPAELPSSVALRQNYPNPFNPATVIRFELPETQDVSLEIYDLSGRKIATLLDGQRRAGRHQVQWAPENLASGLYLYKLQAGNRIITRKMMLIK